MVKSRFERKVLVSSDEEDEEKFSADETGTNANLDPDSFIEIDTNFSHMYDAHFEYIQKLFEYLHKIQAWNHISSAHGIIFAFPK